MKNIIHKYILNKCKYAVRKKKLINSINEELNLDESDSESDNKLIKKIKVMFQWISNFMDLKVHDETRAYIIKSIKFIYSILSD